MIRKISILFFILLIAGCAVGPDYRRPDIQAPTEWRFEDKEARTLINARWWEQFNDPSSTGSLKQP
ncbi:MAG: hypothetical protein WC114_05350 [Smithellaceae bacterium]